MTEKESFADKVRDLAADDDSRLAYKVPDRKRWTEVLMHRWPTALGVAVAVLAAFGLDDGIEHWFSPLIVLMALVYLGAAALDRRWSAWVVFLAGLPLVFFTPPTSDINASVVLLVVAAVLLVVGVVRGQLRKSGGLTLQAAGVFAFGATALAALYVAPELGVYLVAFALIGHAAWDAYHFLRNKVVPRSYAEFCIFVDLLLGVAILFMM